VSLSNCRGLGPSYRLLPKRVRCFFFPFFLLREVRLGLSQLPDFISASRLVLEWKADELLLHITGTTKDMQW
jgi:hypothetical protein